MVNFVLPPNKEKWFKNFFFLLLRLFFHTFWLFNSESIEALPFYLKAGNVNRKFILWRWSPHTHTHTKWNVIKKHFAIGNNNYLSRIHLLSIFFIYSKWNELYCKNQPQTMAILTVNRNYYEQDRPYYISTIHMFLSSFSSLCVCH